MKPFNKIAIAGVAAAAIAATACDFTAFDDLEKQAPATRLEQSGGVTSGTFGSFLVGLARVEKKETKTGARLLVSGVRPSALTTISVQPSGDSSQAGKTLENLKAGLGTTPAINGMAAGPSDETSHAYVAATKSTGQGAVVVVDSAGPKKVETHDAPSPESGAIEGFGKSVVGADLGGAGTKLDIAVGAKGSVVLWRAVTGWPKLEDGKKAIVVKGTFKNWPSGDVTQLAAGALDTSTPEDEIVVGAPASNHISVIHGVAECFKDTSKVCTTVLEIPLLTDAKSANGIAASVLIADVDDDGKNELVIGAPRSGTDDEGAVFIYDLDNDNFKSNTTPKPKELKGPSGAKGFGEALAFGPIDGGTKKLLAVSAPLSTIDGVSKAGQIFVFDKNLKDPVAGSPARLARPQGDEQLGRQLAIVPVKGSGTSTVQVLAATAENTVLMFYGGLTKDHKDTRVR